MNLRTKRLVALLGSLLLLGGGFFGGLRWVERAIAFHPDPYKSDRAWTRPADAEDVWFSTTDGTRLHGWFFESRSQTVLATVIYFHGNGGNISNVGWVGERLATRGFDVLVFDYRGYGRSEGNLKDEDELYADADAAYDYVLSERNAQAASVVLYGQSLGTTAVVDLASRKKSGAIILESGPSSASDMAGVALPWLPRRLHFLARNRFDSARKLAAVHCPVLITHGDPDPTIPTEQGRLLFAAAHEPKKLLIFPGAGHNVFGKSGNKYLDILKEFINNAVSY